MGVALRARARVQINLAVSQVLDIKQVANFPDIVFPIMWFEDVSFVCFFSPHFFPFVFFLRRSFRFFSARGRSRTGNSAVVPGHRRTSLRSDRSAESGDEGAADCQSRDLLHPVHNRRVPPRPESHLHNQIEFAAREPEPGGHQSLRQAGEVEEWSLERGESRVRGLEHERELVVTAPVVGAEPGPSILAHSFFHLIP